MNDQLSKISDIQLPPSVSTLYIDGSFLPLSSHLIPSMAYAWTAIDSDRFILESHYNTIPSLFPSALRSEIFALIHGLDSLPQNSKITVVTDCTQLISLWSTYILLDMLPTLTTLQKRKPHIYDTSWLCPQCNSSPETLDHLWTCPYILPEFSPSNTFKTLLLDLRTVYLYISLPDSFVAEFTAIDCWDCDSPSPSCLRLARGLIPISLTGFLGTYFSSSIIWSILDAPLHDFHFDLYVQIWLCHSVFFHHWESAQGITNKMKSSTIGPSPTSHPFSQISPKLSTPSLATASLDSW
ncbi:hypothetical protein RhiirC2_800718, partial [Rhizophagus irregularis]